MSEPSKKSPALLIGLVVVALIAVGGYFFVSSKEKEEAQRLEALIKEYGFTAESVKVGFFKKSAVITGLKGTTSYPLGATMTLDVESVSATGVNIDALTANKVATLADSLTIKNMKMVVDQPAQAGSVTPAAKQETTVASLTLNAFQGNLAETINVVNSLDSFMLAEKPEEALKNKDSLARLFESLRGYRIGSFSAAGYVSRVDLGLPTPLVTSIDSYTGKDMSMLACGGIALSNLKVNFMNQDMLKIGTMEAGQTSMPDIFTPLLASLGTPIHQAETEPLPMILAALEKTPFLMRGFVMKDVSVQVMMPESISFKSFTLDTELDTGKLVVKNTLEDLVVPPSYYRQSGGGAAMLAQAYGKPLHLSGSVDILGTQKDGKGEFQVKNANLVEKELGSVTVNLDSVFSADGADTLQKLLESASNVKWLLKNAKFIIVDKKAIETALHAQFSIMQSMGSAGDEQAIKSVADLRAMSAGEVRQEAEGEENPDKKAILEGLSKLMERAGTLTITMNPETPLPLNFMDGIDDGTPGAYKITMDYAPEQ